MVLSIAHRGASGHAPENTLEAFRKAVELGADVVEFDVRTTKDGIIVVIHDGDISRTTDGSGHVRDFSLAQIRQFHTANGENIPTFQEVLDVLKGKCTCKIDIKEPGIVVEIITVLRKNGIRGSIITSQIFSVSEKARQLCPEIRTEAGGFKENIPVEEMILSAKRINADIIGPHYRITTKQLVENAHKNGLEVHVWPVDDIGTIERMKETGVDGITTGFPERVKSRPPDLNQ